MSERSREVKLKVEQELHERNIVVELILHNASKCEREVMTTETFRVLSCGFGVLRVTHIILDSLRLLLSHWRFPS